MFVCYPDPDQKPTFTWQPGEQSMASGFNRVILMGNLTRDVELRHTSTNQAVARLGIACSRRWKTPDGEQREETMFIDCEAWGKTGEFISQFFQKGRPILIEGRLKLDQWEDKETKAKRSKHVVVVEAFHFVDSKPGGGGGGGSGGEEGSPAARAGYRPAAAPAGAPGGAPSMGEEDIPF
jgi:single-strand DNA-binding protein